MKKYKPWWESKTVLLGAITMVAGALGMWQQNLVANHPFAASVVGVMVGASVVWLRVLTGIPVKVR